MSRRSREWNEGLAHDLRHPEFARGFIAALIEEGMTLHEALGMTIRAYGIKEFAEVTGLPSSNVSRAINPNYNPSQKVLQKLLRPFQLRLSVVSTEKPSQAA